LKCNRYFGHIAPEATLRKPLRPLANEKKRGSQQQLPGRTSPSILLKIAKKVTKAGGGENCSQEPAAVFSFSTESTVAPKARDSRASVQGQRALC